MPTLNLLYVEDNAILRATICEYLEDLGHAVTARGNAEEALAALATQRFDVLLSDVSLPGRSGLELVREAAAMQPALRLVLATGHTLDRELDQLGLPVQLLAKPFDLDALEAVLNV